MKKELTFWFVYLGILVLLFLMSSTDWIIKEPKPRVYPISIVVDEESEANFINFRKGVDRAASDYNVDTNFRTLFVAGSAYDQVALVKEEVNSGAKALLISPVQADRAMEELLATKAASGGVPYVFFGHSRQDRHYSNVSIDFRAAGERLAQTIIAERRNTNKSRLVYIVHYGDEAVYDRELYDSIASGLSEENFTIENIAISDDAKALTDKLDELTGEYNAPFIVCLDKSGLTAATEAIQAKVRYRWFISGIYGVGSTTYILNKLDDGTIDGLIVWDEYSEGYIAIEKAIRRIKRTHKETDEVLESYYITADDLRKKEFMRMLYPLD